MMQYSDAELAAIMQVASGHHTLGRKRGSGAIDSSVIANYKEAQFHGEIRFDRDVERIVVPRTTSNLSVKATLEEAGRKHGFQVCWYTASGTEVAYRGGSAMSPGDEEELVKEVLDRQHINKIFG